MNSEMFIDRCDCARCKALYLRSPEPKIKKGTIIQFTSILSNKKAAETIQIGK